jgi:hypothetical protein
MCYNFLSFQAEKLQLCLEGFTSYFVLSGVNIHEYVPKTEKDNKKGILYLHKYNHDRI